MTTAHEALILLVCIRNGIGLHELLGIRNDLSMSKCYKHLINYSIIVTLLGKMLRSISAKLRHVDEQTRRSGNGVSSESRSQAEAKFLNAFVGWLVIPCYIESRTTKSLVFHTTVLHSSRWARDSSSASSSFHSSFFLSVPTPSPLRIL